MYRQSLKNKQTSKHKQMKSFFFLLLTFHLVCSFSPSLRHSFRLCKLNGKTSQQIIHAPMQLRLSNNYHFALDKSILPNTHLRPVKSMSAVIILASVILWSVWFCGQFGQLLGVEEFCSGLNKYQQKLKAVESNRKKHLQSIAKDFALWVKFLKEHIFSNLVRNRKVSFGLQNWNVCKLVQIKPASEDYSIYRFKLSGHPDSKVELDIGQEILLCLVDAKGRALKQSFFVSSAPTAKGYFEVLCKNGGLISDGAQFSVAMQFMELGDELAVKAGHRKLSLSTIEGPILNMSILVYEEGIVPTLLLLRSVLADSESTVEQVEVLWVNHHKNDFLLNEEVEQLQSLFGADRLRVTRVVDREAGNGNMRFGEQARAAVSPYSIGRIAVVMAPVGVSADAAPFSDSARTQQNSELSSTHNAVRAKCQELLAAQGYPDGSVALLS